MLLLILRLRVGMLSLSGEEYPLMTTRAQGVLRRQKTLKKCLFEELKISVGIVDNIIHDCLEMKKVLARWVPRILTAKQYKPG